MALIRLKDVTKIYPGELAVIQPKSFPESGRSDQKETGADSYPRPIVALDRVNLVVLNGETMAVIGPSGCGKSTLLRVVAGLERDYTGTIFYDNRVMRDVPPRERYIGMVFQNYALYPHFEGWGNLAFFFKLRHVPDKETEERILATSKVMGIGFKQLLKRKPGVLSGGEQQRVAIGRALVRSPQVFLLDEPLSNLDAKLRTQTRSELKRLLERFKITSIYVTHDQMEAIALADRIAVMREGRIEQVGTYNWLSHNPANAFVAGFVGSPPMNLFAGIIDSGQLFVDNMAIPLPDKLKPRLHTGRRITLGVRPEAAQVSIEATPHPPGLQLRGIVEVVEPDFAHRTQFVHLRTGGLTYAATSELVPPLKIGDEVEVLFPASHFFFFDSESEARLE